MTVDCNYGFGCDVGSNFDKTRTDIKSLLEARGFKIFTQLQLQDIVGNKEGFNFGRYVILGACNPEFARQLFHADPNIGMLMPCNIIIYELRHGGCRVMIKDPARIMDMISNPVAIEASICVKATLEEIIEELKQ